MRLTSTTRWYHVCLYRIVQVLYNYTGEMNESLDLDMV